MSCLSSSSSIGSQAQRCCARQVRKSTLLRRGISQARGGVSAVHRAISQARGGSLKNYESSAIGESSCPVCNACVPSARWPARRKVRARRKGRAKRKMAGETQGAGSRQNAWGGKSAKQREHKTENNRCGKMLGPQSAAREHKKDCPMRQDIV